MQLKQDKPLIFEDATSVSLTTPMSKDTRNISSGGTTLLPSNKSVHIDYVVALDVGGTTIAAGLVGTDKSVIPPEPMSVPINQEGTMQEILKTILNVVARVGDMSKKTVLGVGIGMPGGPGDFDHERGISYVKHKFRSLHGQSIKKPLQDALELPVYFANDAETFILGARWTTNAKAERLLGITLGTGLGACYLVGGEALRTGPEVPKGGELWNVPWRGGIVEDFVSRRFIEATYLHECKQHQELPELKSVREIAEAARHGNHGAKHVFDTFAANLGHALALVVPRFRPDIVVVGGQIAKAFDLFGLRAQEVLGKGTGLAIPLILAPLGNATAIVGAGYHCLRKLDVLGQPIPLGGAC